MRTNCTFVVSFSKKRGKYKAFLLFCYLSIIFLMSGCQQSAVKEIAATNSVTMAATITPQPLFTPTQPLDPTPKLTSTKVVAEFNSESTLPSVKAAENWQIFSEEKDEFSFLYPRDWEVLRVDPNHLQIKYDEAVLTIGFRKLEQPLDLSLPAVAGDFYTSAQFDFIGAPLNVTVFSGEDTYHSERRPFWKVFEFGGSEEIIRPPLAFRIRLANQDSQKTLAFLTPAEIQKFEFIVGSFKFANSLSTQAIGSSINLAEAGLDKTVSLEIGVFNPQIAVSRYLYQHLVNDPAWLEQLIATLNMPLPIQKGAECLEPYELKV